MPVRPPLFAAISGWDLAFNLSRELGGTLPLSRLLADAIDYAERGIAVTRSQADNTAAKRRELAPQPGFAQTFLPGGEPPAAGDLFKQPRLAATLRQLAAAGLDDFYRGDLARSIAADLAQVGSPLTLEDLQRHRGQWRTPLQLQNSLGMLYNMPAPTQGVVSLLILGILDALDIGAIDPASADYVHLCVEAVKQAFAIRDRHVTDPVRMKVDAQRLLDDPSSSRW